MFGNYFRVGFLFFATFTDLLALFFNLDLVTISFVSVLFM